MIKKGKAKKRLNRKPAKYNVVKRLFQLIMFFTFVLFGWLMYCYFVIISHPFEEEVTSADAAIVLGAALWNDRPSPALKERLDHALTLYNENRARHIIVSGGRGYVNQHLSEAEGMRNYLLEQGVSEEHILLEQHSTNTYENLLFTKAIIEKQKFNHVVIVSHSYHAYRTDKIARFLDYTNYQVSGIESKVLNKAYHYTREVLAYSKWVLNSITLRLGIYLD